jgi:hypothetical protein
VLAVGFVLSGMLVGMVGLVLHTTVRRFRELNYHVRLVASELAADPSDSRSGRERR